jgi:hypothetical protein
MSLITYESLEHSHFDKNRLFHDTEPRPPEHRPELRGPFGLVRTAINVDLLLKDGLSCHQGRLRVFLASFRVIKCVAY